MDGGLSLFGFARPRIEYPFLIQSNNYSRIEVLIRLSDTYYN